MERGEERGRGDWGHGEQGGGQRERAGERERERFMDNQQVEVQSTSMEYLIKEVQARKSRIAEFDACLGIGYSKCVP